MDELQPGIGAPIGGTSQARRRPTSLWYVTVTAGAPRARALAAALRKAREASGIGVRELARQLGLSHPTVSAWLNAKRVPDGESVAAFLQACGVTGDQRETILTLVRGAEDPSWLAAGIPGASQGLAGVLDCERTTTEFTEWCPLVMPGLCQTRDYARAIMLHDAELSEREIDGLVNARIDRRRTFTQNRGEDLGPAEYTALINEHALSERIGGLKVLREQLKELLILAALPTVTIRVVPSGDDWHPGLVGPYILYTFADAPPIVHIEHLKSSAFLYADSDIQAFKMASSAIRRRALTPDESVRRIERAIAEVENSA